MKLNIALVLFPQFEELDFAGPFEVFGMAAKYIDQEWSVFTVGQEPVVKGFLGAAIQVDHLFADAPVPDIIVVPGGFGTRPGVKNDALSSSDRVIGPLGPGLRLRHCEGPS